VVLALLKGRDRNIHDINSTQAFETMKKIGFVSLGCEKNLVDTEVMLGLLTQRGYQITPKPQAADIIVVNTCGFIDKAKQESIDTILEMAEYKNSGNCSRLVVTGCLVERYRAEIQQEIPEVDAVLGTTQIESIIQLCENTEPPKIDNPYYLYDEHSPRLLTTPRFTAILRSRKDATARVHSVLSQDGPLSNRLYPLFE
jgi:ribosomal protein S12 methylthiotransferase